MSLFFVLISIALTYFSPPEINPDLAKYHLQQLILFPAFLATVALVSHKIRLQWPQHLLVMGFWFAIVMSRLTSLWFGGALSAFFNFGIVVCVYFLVSLNAFTPTRIRLVCGTVVLCAVVMAGQSIIAFHTGYQAEQLVLVDRIVGWGIVHDPNDFAQLLVVALALLGAFWKRDALFRNGFLLLPACVLIYGIYRTLSRGAVFGIMAILFALLGRKLPRLVSLGMAGMVALALIALGFGGGRDYSMNEGSAAGRVIAWGSGIMDLRAHPLFGVGYGSFTTFNDLTAHNSFVLCFAELGLFGYFFWLAMIITTVVALERIGRLPKQDFQDPRLPGLHTALRAALYAFLTTSFFLSRTYTETLFILVALCGSIIHLSEEEAVRKAVYPPYAWMRITVVAEAVSVVIMYVLVRLRTA